MLSEPSDKLKGMSQKLSVKNKVAEKLRMDVHSETSIRVIQVAHATPMRVRVRVSVRVRMI